MSWRVRATVERIIDGDTFVATFDLGWGVLRREVPGCLSRVRILAYNAPERNTPDHPRAVAALSTVLPIGARVWVESQKLDSFGRALCHVFTEDGKNILEALPQEWVIP